MNAEIISVGSELLSGKQSNTNAQYLSEQLKHLGVEVALQITVGDNENDLKRVLSSALSRSNIVILTGGLGPTKDDITKDAVCELLGLSMKVDEPSLNKIESYFAKKGEKMAENNIRQARIPEGSVILKNDVGLAPGCLLKSGNQCIIMLPGVPYEMRPMFENSVKPFLKTMAGYSVVSKTVNVFGMSESLVAQALDDIISKGDPIVATYAGGGKIDVFVSKRAEDIKDAIRDVDVTVEEIERRLGDAVFGVDEPSMQHAVVSELVSRDITIATAESCTGGLLSKKITDISGASLCFGFGVTSYSETAKNAILGVEKESLKQFGAVSAETACQMAVGAMTRAGADMGVSITGYAGPASSLGEPVGLVFISVCNKETVWVKRFEFAPAGKETREHIREMATMHALDMIRRVINGFAIFNSQRLPVSEIANSTQSKEANKAVIMFRNEKAAAAVKAEPEKKSEATQTEETNQTEKTSATFAKTFKGYIEMLAWKLLPNKKDDRVEKVRKSVFLTASLALIVSICYILGFFLGIQQNNNLYKDLAELKTQKPASSINYPEGYLEEFGILYQENPDIAGWIEINGTVLNYPVVKGDDNDYYLNHNFYGKKERHGVPFMDYRNDLELLDANTILHGHNMKSDNQMFSELENYYKGSNALSYYRQHPLITFDTVYEQMQWKIFAVFTCNVNTGNGEVFPYYDFITASSEDEFIEFVDEIRTRSIFNIPVDVKPGDNLLTLSTCYYDYDGQRLVVVARKVRDGESTDVDVNKAALNSGDNKYIPLGSDDTSSYDYSNIINNSGNYRPSSSSSSKTPSNDWRDESYWNSVSDKVDIPDPDPYEPPQEEEIETSIPETEEETPPEDGDNSDNQSTASGDNQSTTSGDNQGTASGDNQSTASGDNQSTASGDNQSTASGDNQGTASGDNQSTASGNTQTTAPAA